MKKRKSNNQSRSKTQAKRPNLVKLETFIRLQLALSRRDILALVEQHEVLINGRVAHSLIEEVHPHTDTVVVSGKTLRPHVPEYEYYKYHKPKGIISTLSDPESRWNLGDIVQNISTPVFPVGRLDRKTSGLMLFTNDGDLANAVMHPAFSLEKRYRVTVNFPITKATLDRLKSGFILEDGPVQFTHIEKLDPKIVEVSLTEGRNHIVRRAFAHLGLDVVKLKRLAIGPVLLGTLAEGAYQKLNKAELFNLKSKLSL